MSKLKNAFKATWHFIWEDNSIWSWIVNIILAFLIIKFLLYPGLGLALGTSHPIVAVVSGSMQHDGNFDRWWESICVDGNKKTQAEIYQSYGLTKEQFNNFDFYKGFNAGDLMIIKNSEIPNLGEVIVFQADHLVEPIIHRVVKTDTNIIKTKGDHNCGSSSFEENVQKDKIIGKAILKIPYLGWVKIIFVKIIGLIVNIWS